MEGKRGQASLRWGEAGVRVLCGCSVGGGQVETRLNDTLVLSSVIFGFIFWSNSIIKLR